MKLIILLIGLFMFIIGIAMFILSVTDEVNLDPNDKHNLLWMGLSWIGISIVYEVIALITIP